MKKLKKKETLSFDRSSLILDAPTRKEETLPLDSPTYAVNRGIQSPLRGADYRLPSNQDGITVAKVTLKQRGSYTEFNIYHLYREKQIIVQEADLNGKDINIIFDPPFLALQAGDTEFYPFDNANISRDLDNTKYQKHSQDFANARDSLQSTGSTEIIKRTPTSEKISQHPGKITIPKSHSTISLVPPSNSVRFVKKRISNSPDVAGQPSSSTQKEEHDRFSIASSESFKVWKEDRRKEALKAQINEPTESDEDLRGISKVSFSVKNLYPESLQCILPEEASPPTSEEPNKGLKDEQSKENNTEEHDPQARYIEQAVPLSRKERYEHPIAFARTDDQHSKLTVVSFDRNKDRHYSADKEMENLQDPDGSRKNMESSSLLLPKVPTDSLPYVAYGPQQSRGTHQPPDDYDVGRKYQYPTVSKKHPSDEDYQSPKHYLSLSNHPYSPGFTKYSHEPLREQKYQRGIREERGENFGAEHQDPQRTFPSREIPDTRKTHKFYDKGLRDKDISSTSFQVSERLNKKKSPDFQERQISDSEEPPPHSQKPIHQALKPSSPENPFVGSSHASHAPETSAPVRRQSSLVRRTSLESAMMRIQKEILPLKKELNALRNKLDSSLQRSDHIILSPKSKSTTELPRTEDQIPPPITLPTAKAPIPTTPRPVITLPIYRSRLYDARELAQEFTLGALAATKSTREKIILSERDLKGLHYYSALTTKPLSGPHVAGPSHLYGDKKLRDRPP